MNGRDRLAARLPAWLIVLTLAMAACGGAAQTTTTVDLRAVEAGGTIFSGTCAVCHGADAQGIEGLGRNLVGNMFVAERSDADMVAFLKEGRPSDHPDNTTGVAMPPRGGNANLTDQDLGDVVAFLRSLKG